MIYTFMNDFLCKITHFYERLWGSLLAVVGIIPRTGSDEEIRLEAKASDKKNELDSVQLIFHVSRL